MAAEHDRNVDLPSLCSTGSDDESSTDGGSSPPYPFRHPPLDSPLFWDHSWRLPVPDPCTPYTSMDEERLKLGRFRLRLLGDEYQRRKALGLIAKRQVIPLSPTPPPWSPTPPPPRPPPRSRRTPATRRVKARTSRAKRQRSNRSKSRQQSARPLRATRRRSVDRTSSPPTPVPRRCSVRLLRIKEQRLCNPSPDVPRRRESARLLRDRLRRLSDRQPSTHAAPSTGSDSVAPPA